MTGAQDGLALDEYPFTIKSRPGRQAIAAQPRNGLTRGGATPWRFGLQHSRFLSRPFARHC